MSQNINTGLRCSVFSSSSKAKIFFSGYFALLQKMLWGSLHNAREVAMIFFEALKRSFSNIFVRQRTFIKFNPALFAVELHRNIYWSEWVRLRVFVHVVSVRDFIGFIVLIISFFLIILGCSSVRIKILCGTIEVFFQHLGRSNAIVSERASSSVATYWIPHSDYFIYRSGYYL